jgi:hypothetical protein
VRIAVKVEGQEGLCTQDLVPSAFCPEALGNTLSLHFIEDIVFCYCSCSISMCKEIEIDSKPTLKLQTFFFFFLYLRQKIFQNSALVE